MTVIVLLLAIVGLSASALCSGLETAFYRATRMRLVLDAMGGDLVARCMVWMTNRPTWFVATILVGNNVANYLVSLAIVLGAHAAFGGSSQAAELVAPLVLAPVLFVYGELLPKHLGLEAPNRLLRLGGPVFLVLFVALLPASLLLWSLNWLLARFVAEPPEQVRLTLARRELQSLLDEGHEVGILHAAQRRLARSTFALGTHRVDQLAVPLADVPRAHEKMSRQDVLQMAGRYRIADVPVEAAGKLAGYARVVELALGDSPALGPLRPLIAIPRETSHLDALVQLENAGENLALVVDSQGEAVGILTARSLRGPLFHGQ
ncbi:MAG TPA: CNNM domain-containing protein [Thermoguttaceae bacterium]|nr:CNNM domain-containing protein [Thermoguttaceae bacterium]